MTSTVMPVNEARSKTGGDAGKGKVAMDMAAMALYRNAKTGNSGR